MSEPTAPEHTATPGQPDEPLGHDGPTFVHNGIIRFPMGDQVVRVRRPFLGELKAIRLSRQEIHDLLVEESRRVAELGRGYQSEAAEVVRKRNADEIDQETYDAAIKEIQAADNATARELDDKREQVMLDWWSEQVFAVLALDPVPDQMVWPTWMLDRSLDAKCFTHWRTVPTGPG